MACREPAQSEQRRGMAGDISCLTGSTSQAIEPQALIGLLLGWLWRMHAGKPKAVLRDTQPPLPTDAPATSRSIENSEEPTPHPPGVVSAVASERRNTRCRRPGRGFASGLELQTEAAGGRQANER